jgi:hypothetical protein
MRIQIGDDRMVVRSPGKLDADCSGGLKEGKPSVWSVWKWLV